jgi:hypothetical protein
VSKIATDSLEERVLQIIEDKKPQTVSQLIALLREQLQITEEQAQDQITDLEKRGKLKFTSQPLPSSSKLSSYLKTSQANWYWITTIFALLTVTLVFVIPEYLVPWSYVRNVVGAIFVVYLPGYTFIKTVFPVKLPIETSEQNFDKIERFALSVGVSLVIVPFVGLLLNYTSWGIGLVPLTFSLFAFSLVFASIALIREHQEKMKTQNL